MSESSDSKVAGSGKIKRAYSVEKIKLFLQSTKNTKGVKIQDYLSDRELFSNSATDEK